jgi:hypothetical protein
VDTQVNAPTSDVNPMAMTAKGRYSQLESLREPYLRRARDASKVTLPYLIPPLGHTPVSQLYTPYQSLGSRGVNNLSSKLLLTLLPPNSPFFKFSMTDMAMEELAARSGQQAMKGKIDAALGKYERSVQDEIEQRGYRTQAFPAFKHLLVAGNVLLFLKPEGGMRVFPLTTYVCKRDPDGNLIEIVIKEMVSPVTLPEKIRELVSHKDGKNPNNDVELYTWVKRTESNWESHQEIEDKCIESTKGTYPIAKSPYLALRWAVIDGEDYGRGYVEEYLGDLYSLEGLCQAIVEGSAAAAKILIMVKPGAAVTQRAVAQAPSGAVLTGNVDDVGILQMEKYADFRVAKETITSLEQRLAFAFLLNTAIQRQGERVTAEEIRYMARELEDALGGVYSVLAQEFQLPLVTRIVYTLERAKKLPKLPEGFVKPEIVTGIEALGRGQDLQKLQAFFQAAATILGPEQMASRVNVTEALNRIGAATSVNTDGLVKTDEQIAAEQQQQQMAAAGNEAIGPGINAMGKVVTQSIANQQKGEAPQTPKPPSPEG